MEVMFLFTLTHLWPFSKSKFNLKSECVNLAPACLIECLLYLPNVRAIQYKLGPERLTRLGYSNELRWPLLPLHCLHIYISSFQVDCLYFVNFKELGFRVKFLKIKKWSHTLMLWNVKLPFEEMGIRFLINNF